MKRFFEQLTTDEKKKLIIMIVVIGIGIVSTIIYFSMQFISKDDKSDNGTTINEQSDIDKQAQEIGADDIAKQVEGTDELITIGGLDSQSNDDGDLGDIYYVIDSKLNESLKTFKKGKDTQSITSVTARNGKSYSSLNKVTESLCDSFFKAEGINESDYKDLDLEVKQQLFLGESAYKYLSTQYTYNKNSKEYSDDSDKLLSETISSYQKGNFQEIKSKIGGLIKKYNFTNAKNRIIIQIYADACFMINYQNMETSSQQSVLKGLKNPISLSLSPLFIENPRVREVVILDDYSLSPITEGENKILKYLRLDNNSSEFKERAVSETQNLYKIEIITGDSEEIVSYISESASHELKVVGYYSSNGAESSAYQTVMFWKTSGINIP